MIGLILVVIVVLSGLAPVAWANPTHDRLQKMSSGERNGIFTTVLKGSGENCDAVTRNFFQGATESGDVLWNVACRNGKSYLIKINNDAEGSNKILSCAVLKAFNGGECFKKF